MEITSFSGEFEFLSNFFNVHVRFIHDFGNSEAAYQAQKAKNPADAEDFTQYNGGKSKRKGRKLEIRADWDEIKLACMSDVIFAKFFQNPALAAQLIATNDAKIVEGNTWHDIFWGIDAETGEGQNNLGKILMKTRAELKNPEISLPNAENFTLTRFTFPDVDGSRMICRLKLPNHEEFTLNFERVYKIESRDRRNLDETEIFTWNFRGRTFYSDEIKNFSIFRDEHGVNLIQRRNFDVTIYIGLKNPPPTLEI